MRVRSRQRFAAAAALLRRCGWCGTRCAYSATLGTADGSLLPPGFATVRRDTAGRVLVQVTDASNNPKDLPFHLIVAC